MKDQKKTNPLLHYIQTHPLLNLSGIARELGMDPSNFKKVVMGKAGLKEDVESKLEVVLREYGYGDRSISPEEWEDYEGVWVMVDVDGSVCVGTLWVEGKTYQLQINNSPNLPRIFLNPTQHKITPLSKLVSNE